MEHVLAIALSWKLEHKIGSCMSKSGTPFGSKRPGQLTSRVENLIRKRRVIAWLERSLAEDHIELMLPPARHRKGVEAAMEVEEDFCRRLTGTDNCDAERL